MFQDFNLNPAILKAIDELGFKEPMPIQAEVLPILLNQRTDLVGLAQTGTGKTAAFGLPLLQNIDASKRCVQALVLCPTRELCMQISKDLLSYAKYMPEVMIVPVYGGASIEQQFKALAKKPQIIASPLLETSIAGAKRLLINITMSEDILSSDVDNATKMITDKAADNVEFIFGTAFKEDMKKAYAE